MSVLDQAQNFSGGVVSAARQRDRWARQEANATDDERREQYREAIADLEARFPEIAGVPIGGAEAFARERGHGTRARSPVHEGRRRPGAGTKARSGKASPKTPTKSAPRKSSSRPRRSPRLSRGRPTPRVDRAIAQTGIPGAVSSAGSITMATLGATVGLAFGYLVLSSAETPGTGAAALPKLVSGVTRALHRFLSQKDVFPEGSVPGAAGGGAAFNEGPGGDIATAAGRLKAAGRGRPGFLDARPGTFSRHRGNTSLRQGHVHR